MLISFVRLLIAVCVRVCVCVCVCVADKGKKKGMAPPSEDTADTEVRPVLFGVLTYLSSHCVVHDHEGRIERRREEKSSDGVAHPHCTACT